MPNTDLNSSPPRLLVVDDEPEIRQMVAICLQKSGYEVSSASCAEEAYTLIESMQFDVIITDVMMPGEDGLEFLANVHQRFPEVPVILMTGYAQLQMAVNAIKNGAFDFIHKPFDFSYLRQVVKRALDFTRLVRIERNYRTELEETVARRTADLKEALSELERVRVRLIDVNREKSKFLSTLTHEMRTPMNGVIGSLDLLADTGMSGEQKEYLEMARVSADSMLSLINQMLSFSPGGGATHPASSSLIDIPVALEALALEYRPRFMARGLGFEMRIAPAVPRKVYCSGEQLARVLDILLGNALKFTSKGGVRLELVSNGTDGNRVALIATVRDSGIGISPAMQEQIFEPFVQADSSFTRRYGGAGLGLSIARQTAELINGSIWVESVPDEGSSFHFQFTVEVPEP